MYRVKICGITTPDDALLAAEAGADALGINFYAKSPRQVSPQQASVILQELRRAFSPAQVAVYGLFVNEAASFIRQTVADVAEERDPAELAIQLHGDESPEFLQELAQGSFPLPVVRAFRANAQDLRKEAAYLARCGVLKYQPQAVLLDALVDGSFGGTGQTVDWAALAPYQGQFQGLPLILAGGLSPENISQAIAAGRPWGVDVASGVEISPGKKDPAKVYAFVAAAKTALSGG